MIRECFMVLCLDLGGDWGNLPDVKKLMLVAVAVASGALVVVAARHRPEPPAKPSVLASVRAEIPIQADDILFLGDSICALPEWHELLDDARTRNRAKSGATTADLLMQPTGGTVVLSVGVNDLQRRIPIVDTRANLAAEAARLDAARLLVIPVMAPHADTFERVLRPHHARIHRAQPGEVAAINAELHTAFPDAIFVDVSGLTDAQGRLRASYTDDGLHPNGRGYIVLAQAIRNALACCR